MNTERFVIDVISQLTGQTPDVTIEEDEYGAVITVAVYGTVSRLIGHNGETVDAFRCLLKAIGHNGKHRIKLRVTEQAR